MPPNLQNADTVCRLFEEGARANLGAACRVKSIEQIHWPGRLIATGDLHDNPMHFGKLIRAAGMEEPVGGTSALPLATGHSPLALGVVPSHLVLHEIIHPDRLVNGMDFSYRVLAKGAALKAKFPEHVHILLGNHELAQYANAQIIKDGVKSVDVFRAGLEYVFGEETPRVEAAMRVFIRSLPIALKCVTPKGDILVAHSLPPAAMMNRFDPSLLSRELTEADYEPRRGAAYLMVWGRGYDAELLEDLVERWGVWMFVLGHEKVENGAMFVPPNALVLNSDHARGVYVPIDLEHPPRPEDAVGMAVRLAD